MTGVIEKKSLKVRNVALFGMIMGGIIVAFDMIPAFSFDTFLYLSFASGTFGIWAFLSIILMLLSENAKQTFINVLVFLSTMSIIYYGIEAIRDSLITYQTMQSLSEIEREMFGLDGQLSFICFEWDSLLFWLIVSLISATGTYMIVVAKEKNIIYTVLTAMPLAVLLTEGVQYTVKFCSEFIGLVPVICDLAGLVICFICLYETNKKKLLSVPFIILFSIILHHIF